MAPVVLILVLVVALSPAPSRAGSPWRCLGRLVGLVGVGDEVEDGLGVGEQAEGAGAALVEG